MPARWAPTKVVPGCAATSASNDSISRPCEGNPGPQNDHSGWASSSSSRSLWRSTGSKKAGGSAVWISTGRPSSPAAAKTGAARSSSGSSSSPAASRKPSPSVFQTLSPRAPASAERRSDSRQPLAEVVARRRQRPVELAEGEEAAGVGAVEAVEVRLELGVPAAVEVDRGLDRVAVAELEVGLDARPPRRRGGARRGRRRPSRRRGRASGRGGCGSRSPRSAGARPGCARARSLLAGA